LQEQQWRTVIHYTPEMRDSITKVAATRKERMKQSFTKLKPEEKKALLQKFHPDYKPRTTRELLARASKGNLIVN